MQGIEEQDFDQKLDLGTWKRLFKYAFSYRGVVLQILLTMGTVAAIDICYPLLARYAIDNFVVQRSSQGVLPFALLYLALVVLQSLGTWMFVERGGKLETLITARIRDDAFCHLQELSFSYYDKTPVGYLLARTVSDVTSISEIIAWSIVDVMWALVYAVGCFAVMFALSPKLALIVMLIVPFLAVVSVYFQRRILRCQRDVRKVNSRITGAYNESIMGAMTTKTLVREEANYGEFKVLIDEMRRTSVHSSVLSSTFMPLVMLLGSVGTAMAVVFGGGMITVGAISLGTLAAFINYTTQLFDPIQSLARIMAEFQTAQASAERVISLIDTPLEIREKPEVERVFGTNFEPKRENWPPITGEVEFKDVSFGYNQKELVLKNFNLLVKPGETIALVGETGAGKSTIVNLVCRFYEPTSGQVLIDGVDYRERSSLWLQESLGYVLQTPHLFSGTIEENIKFARPGATRQQVEEAARLVSAHDFITALKDGYDTQVGEGGALLSTGQKQLVSFARVILADPRIFVLDEATSSIDTETEKLIQRAITRILKGRTSFIVAHRLSTIRDADRILVIRDGGISESGSHSELMALRGYYYDLYTNQFRDEQQMQALKEAGE